MNARQSCRPQWLDEERGQEDREEAAILSKLFLIPPVRHEQVAKCYVMRRRWNERSSSLEKDVAPERLLSCRWSAKSSLEQNANSFILTEHLSFFHCNIPQGKMDGNSSRRWKFIDYSPVPLAESALLPNYGGKQGWPNTSWLSRFCYYLLNREAR